MRLTPGEIEIGELEGFDKNDIFGRKSFGEGLINIFENVEQPLVMVLDSSWGTGKTVFVKMLAGELRKKKFPVIYFDAFKNDYFEDAFLAIAGEVYSYAKKQNVVTQEAEKEFFEKTKIVLRKMLKSGAKVGVKALTRGAMDDSELADTFKVTESDMSGFSEESVEALLEEHFLEREKIYEAFEHFRSALSALASELSSAERPLIFIIDELDRCRPPFSLELLEKIKHFFSVEGVHFLLSTHLEQLSNSVSHVYGLREESRVYLQKFYHISVDFPSRSLNKIDVVTKYTDFLIENFCGSISDGRFDKKNLAAVLSHVAKNPRISLRSMERIIGQVIISTCSVGKHKCNPVFIIGLGVLKVIAPDLYEKAKGGVLQFAEASSVLGIDPDANDIFVIWWKWGLKAQLDDADFAEISAAIPSDESQSLVIPRHCAMLENVQDFSF